MPAASRSLPLAPGSRLELSLISYLENGTGNWYFETTCQVCTPKMEGDLESQSVNARYVSNRSLATGSGRGGTGAECTIEVVVRPCGVKRSRIASRSSIDRK